MPTETTYTALRENLASYLDRVIDDREVVVVKRRGARDVAIIAADELADWKRRRTFCVRRRMRGGCVSRSRNLRETIRRQLGEASSRGSEGTAPLGGPLNCGSCKREKCVGLLKSKLRPNFPLTP